MENIIEVHILSMQYHYDKRIGKRNPYLLYQPPNFLNKNEQLSELISSLIHFVCLLKTIAGRLKFIQIRIGLTQRF